MPFISSRSAVCKPAHDQKDPEILLVTPGFDWLDLLGFFSSSLSTVVRTEKRGVG